MSDTAAIDRQKLELNRLVEQCKAFTPGPNFRNNTTHNDSTSAKVLQRVRDFRSKISETEHGPKPGPLNFDSERQSFNPSRWLPGYPEKMDSTDLIDLRTGESEEPGAFIPYLKATISELKQNNSWLMTIATRQMKIIEDLQNEVSECKERIDILEEEVDEHKQERILDRVLISGPSMTTFIENSQEHRDGVRDLGTHSLGRLRSLVALSTIDREKFSRMNPDMAAATPEVTPESLIIPSDHPDVKELVEKQGILSATLLTSERLIVHTSSREAALNILTRGKHTKRQLQKVSRNVASSVCTSCVNFVAKTRGCPSPCFREMGSLPLV